MSDEEDDYMSDKFLSGITNHNKEDVRPGLLHKRSQQRELEIYKRRKIGQSQPKIKILQNIVLQEGLSTAISSENKGFQMLAKMGYKSGQSLGKSQTGIIEPISIEVKSNKGGLGNPIKVPIMEKQAQLSRKNARLEADGHVENFSQMQSEWQSGLYEKKAADLLKRDFFKAQRVCENLDLSANVKKPQNDYFWTKKIEEPSEELNTDNPNSIIVEEEEISQYKLESILLYLRHLYWYCMYCGLQADSLNDLKHFCPGPFRDDHAD